MAASSLAAVELVAAGGGPGSVLPLLFCANEGVAEAAISASASANTMVAAAGRRRSSAARPPPISATTTASIRNKASAAESRMPRRSRGSALV